MKTAPVTLSLLFCFKVFLLYVFRINAYVTVKQVSICLCNLTIKFVGFTAQLIRIIILLSYFVSPVNRHNL